MGSDRRTLEIMLETVRLDTPGGESKDEGNHLVAVTLVYPRPSVQEKAAVKTVALTKGKADLSARSWTDRIMFKEVVEGPFGISVDISEQLSEDAIGKLVDALASAAVKLGGDGISDIAAGPVAGGLMKIPLQYLGKAISSAEKFDARSVGSGSIDMCIGSDWEAGVGRKMKIPLRTFRDIRLMRREMRRGVMTTKLRTLVKSGESNGYVELAICPYD